jgi:hypothetical protein
MNPCFSRINLNKNFILFNILILKYLVLKLNRREHFIKKFSKYFLYGNFKPFSFVVSNLIILYMITKESLEKLEKSLPYGARSRVAKKMETNYNFISEVLQGRITTEKGMAVLQELTNKMIKFKQMENNISQSLNKL